jgi:hypothetical protein
MHLYLPTTLFRRLSDDFNLPGALERALFVAGELYTSIPSRDRHDAGGISTPPALVVGTDLVGPIMILQTGAGFQCARSDGPTHVAIAFLGRAHPNDDHDPADQSLNPF